MPEFSASFSTPQSDSERLVAAEARIANLERQLKQCRSQLQQEQSERQHSEDQLRAVMENAIAAISRARVFADQTYEVIYLSPGCEAIFGFTAQQLSADPTLWRSRIPPADRDTVVAAAYQKIFAAAPYRMEYRFQHRDGSLRWILATGNSRWDEAMQCWLVTAVSTDISDCKAAENTLRQYQSIVARTPDSVALVDADYRYKLVNQTYLDWWHSQWDDFVEHPVSESLGEEAFQFLIKPSLDRSLAGEIVYTEEWFDYPDGQRRFIGRTFAPYLEADGTISGVVINCRDLTALHYAEASLSENEQFLSSFYNHTQVSFFVVDVMATGEFRYVSLNPAYQRLTGLSPENLERATPDDILPPLVAESVKYHYQRCVEAGTSITYEEYLPFGGQDFSWITTLTPIRNQQSRIYRLVGSSLNISDRVAAEQAREKQRHKAQVLSELTLKIRQSIHLDEILQATVNEVLHMLWADRVVVYRFSPDRSGIVTTEAVRSTEYAILGEMFADPCFEAAQVGRYQQGEVTVIPDILDSVLPPCFQEFLQRISVRAYLVVPLLQNQTLWGLLITHDCTAPRHWMADEIDLLQQLANQVGIALAHSHLVEALQLSQARFAGILGIATDAIISLDLSQRITLFNQGAEQIFGYTAQEIIGSPLERLWSEPVADQYCSQVRQFAAINPLANPVEERFELVARRKNGTEFPTEATLSKLELAGDTIVTLILRDITERKAAEAALHQRTQREQALNQVIQAIRNSLDLKTIFSTAVREIGRLLQVESAEIVQYFAADDLWMPVAEYRQHRDLPSHLGVPFPDAENPVSAQLKRLELVRLDEGDVSHSDTTTIAVAFPSAWLLVPLAQRSDIVDTATTEVWGSFSLLRASHLGRWHSWEVELACAVADQLAIAIHQADLFQQAQRELAERQRAEAALHQLNQQLEQRVEERTTQLQIALSAAQMGTWEWDLVTQVEHWSPTTYALLGWQTDAQGRVLDQTGAEISPYPTHDLFLSQVHPEDLDRFSPIAQQPADAYPHSTFIYDCEFRVCWQDGTVHWCYTRGSQIYDPQGQAIAVVGVCMDITDRKQAEEILRRNQTALAEAQRVAHVGSWELDAATLTISWSAETFRIFSRNPDEPEPTYTELLQYHFQKDRDRLSYLVNRALHYGDSYEVDLQIVRPNGSICWIFAKGQPIFDARGAVIRLFGTVLDITARKQAEEALRKRADHECLLRTITQHISQFIDLDNILAAAVTDVRRTLQSDRVLIYRIQPDGSGTIIAESVAPDYPLLLGSAYGEGIFPLESHERYLKGRVCVISDRSQDLTLPCLVEFMAAIGVQAKLAVPIVQKNLLWGLLIVHQCDAPRYWQEWDLTLLRQIANQLAIGVQQADLYQQVQRQLSDRIQAEQHLRASLQEKEVLLKEIHHRVKNNLQVISSLLSLQSSSIQDPQALQPFLDSQHRIEIMATIHERLYRSGNLASINFADYVQDLVYDLFHSYLPSNSAIRWQLDIANIDLDLDIAIPCGLIINELVSNAIKHAFPNREDGEISILFNVQDAQFTLAVKDDGIGFPDGLDLQKTDSLGLQVICALTRQLEGTLELSCNHGSTIVIYFGKIE